MKFIKKLIIILIILLIVLLIAFVVLSRKETNTNEIEGKVITNDSEIIIDKNIKLVRNTNSYYTIENCIKDYFQLIYSTLKQNSTSLQKNKQKIYNMLSKQYIEKNKITVDNVLEKIDTITSSPILEINKMQYLEGEYVQTYIIYGKLNNKDIYYLINTDDYNKTFSIEPINIGISTEELQTKKQRIEKNNNNGLIYIKIDNITMCMYYLANYKNKILNNPTEAYQYLDKQYRTLKFGNLENFNNYITSRRNEISNITLDSYKVNYYNGYTEYVCKDNLDNYYIFHATAVMEYTTFLDIYTIDLEEMKGKYLKFTEQEKVAYNIQKIIDAINDKDYNYVYSKLAEEFRKQNFNTVQDLQIYIQNNFFDNNFVELVNFSQVQNLYTYSTKIYNGNKNLQKEKTFIMQLNSEMDFEMSFNID